MPIDATDVTLDADRLGLGKPVDWSGIPASQSDFNPIPPAAKFDPNISFKQWEKPSASVAPQKFNPEVAFSQWESKAAPIVPQSDPMLSGPPIPPERMTPQQQADYAQRLKEGNNTPGWWTQNLHPFSGMAPAANEAGSQLMQGFRDIGQGNVATGTGNVAMGGLGLVANPLMSIYNETTGTLGKAIGNPQAANVAGMALPGSGVVKATTAALPLSRAANQIIKLVGPENVTNALQRLEANPNLSLMDVSEPVKTVTAGLANSPETPAAQNAVRSAYLERTAGRQDMVQNAVDRTLGPPMNVKDVTDQLTENLRNVGDKLIQPTLQGAQHIGVQPILQRLDKVINSPTVTDATKTELQRYRQQIVDASPADIVDPNVLHNIQWPLRSFAENLAKSTSGVEKNMAGPLMSLRNDMVDAIDVASGGKYKPALAQYRNAAAVPEAFDKGYNGVFKTGGIEDFPEYFEAWKKGDSANNIAPASAQELAAAKVGAITRIRQTIGAMQSGARRGENILNPEFAQQKLATLFGPEQTQQLSGLLSDARDMADTNSLLYKNSKTAQVTAGQNYFQPRQVGTPTGGGVGVSALGGMAAMMGHPEGLAIPALIGAEKGIKLGAQYLGRLSDQGTATTFAKLASASDGPTRNQLIGILRSAQNSGSGNKLSNLTPSLLRLAAP